MLKLEKAFFDAELLAIQERTPSCRRSSTSVSDCT
jgi:hypothetical protein